jgi:hypothetical protein
MKGIRIQSVETGDTPFIDLEIIDDTLVRQQRLLIDKVTALELGEACRQRPFRPEASAEEYSYWIDTLAHSHKSGRAGGGQVIRTDPRILVLVRRGKSRVRVAVPCTPPVWESLSTIMRSLWSEDIRRTAVAQEREQGYTWAED